MHWCTPHGSDGLMLCRLWVGVTVLCLLLAQSSIRRIQGTCSFGLTHGDGSVDGRSVGTVLT